MKVTKEGSVPKRTFSGICGHCGAEVEVLENELPRERGRLWTSYGISEWSPNQPTVECPCCSRVMSVVPKVDD